MGLPLPAASVFERAETFSPAMGFADGWRIVLQRRIPESIILTTDDRDFATFRVPFASPKGVFAPEILH